MANIFIKSFLIVFISLFLVGKSFGGEISNENPISIEEIKILSEPEGVQIKVLELKKRIESQIEVASLILYKLNNSGKNTQLDLTFLNLKQAEFEGVLLGLEGIDVFSSFRNISDKFIFYKQKSIVITTQFREALQGKLTNEDLILLKKTEASVENRIIRSSSSDLESLRERYNQKKIKNLYSDAFGNDSLILSKFEKGEINLSTLRSNFEDKFAQLSTDEKSQLTSKFETRDNSFVEDLSSRMTEFKSKKKVFEEEELIKLNNLNNIVEKRLENRQIIARAISDANERQEKLDKENALSFEINK